MIKVLSRRKGRFGYRNRLIYIYMCSDGKERDVHGLGIVAGVKGATIQGRITRRGYKHPNLLSGPITKGYDLDGNKIIYSPSSEEAGNDEWLALGG